MDDFYMLLPSDSCSNIHTNNSANNFTVSWQNPIDLSNSKVALTNMTLIQETPYKFSKYGLSYGREERRNFVQYIITPAMKMEIVANPYEDYYWKRHPPQVEIILNEGYHLEIKSDCKFDISWKSRWFGTLQSTLQDDGKYIAVSERPVLIPDKFTLALEFTVDRRVYDNIDLNTNGDWRTIDDMIEEVKQKTDRMFKRFHVDEYTNRMVIEFSADSEIDYLLFENGFEELLGFDKNILRQGSFHMAVHQHKFFYQVEQLYIYSSICEPMYVGNNRVPLLASLCRDKKTKSRITNMVIEKPMYVNVQVSEMNSIDIDIPGVPFLPNTKVILTLHFVYKHCLSR